MVSFFMSFNPTGFNQWHLKFYSVNCYSEPIAKQVNYYLFTTGPGLYTYELHNLTFDDYVTAVSKACYFPIQALRHIWASLPEDVAKTVACSIVSSRLDYCNSLLFGMSERNFSKLQCIQNTLARLLTSKNNYNNNNNSGWKPHP